MTPQQFVKKWAEINVNEIAAAQSHFLDVCDLVGHPRPYDNPTTQEDFRFEKPAQKTTGSKGRADAFYKGKFVWEYKGAHANLDKAYEQVLLYRDALGNPPLLIVSDTQRIIIHTNYTNTIREKYVIELSELLLPAKLALLKACFARADEIERVFKPTRTQELVTKANANTFVAVANELKQWNPDEPPEKVAHFITRILFALFAEDMGLLSDHLFRKTISKLKGNVAGLTTVLRTLFDTMRSGGWFGSDQVPYFNGNLFDDDYIPTLPGGLDELLLNAAYQDWKEIDPTIFGTLFERIIDPATRAPLGAHYTSKADILLIVEPVLMQPLRREWEALRPKTKRLARRDKAAAHALLRDFSSKIAATKVLDPACGSGNFLYVALQALLSLQKEVIVHARRNELGDIPLTVSPHQLYGIEINPYAHELAQIVIWIGYLQWRDDNGFSDVQEPLLQPLDQIERKDAILAYDADGNPVEPVWPSADVIIGNPPFLGAKKVASNLGVGYIADVRSVFEDSLPSFTDLVTYWFERARNQVELGLARRVGLIATNSIGMGTNLPVLKNIKASGDIFLAWDDKAWVLDGAAVRVAIVGFDDGTEKTRKLNGSTVQSINADLTAGINLTLATTLLENSNLAFIGTQKSGSFDIEEAVARKWLSETNSSGVDNADVVLPWVNGSDVVRRPRNKFVIYFDESLSEETARKYVLPFEHTRTVVKSERKAKHFAGYPHWLHWRPRPAFRAALKGKSRYIITPRVSKHRVFAWLGANVIHDSATVGIASESDYFFGVLHSKLHEMWALRLGTWLGKGNDPRYTLTTTFETFPFPWPPGTEPSEADDPNVADIADVARELVAWRQTWLHPLKNGDGIDPAYEKRLKKRTLTNLYNALQHYRAARAAGETHTVAFKNGWKKAVRSDITIPQIIDLHDIHTALDHAVLDCYGWPHDLTDEQILERLLALNLERAAAQEEKNFVTPY